MAYLVRADLLDRLSEQQLVQLTDDAKSGVADETRITAAMAQAEAEIDGYVAVKYAVPVVPAPQLLKVFAVAIAAKNLYGRRQRVPDNVRAEYDDAIAKLKDIAKGVMTLGAEPAPAESAKSSAGEVFGDERIFSRDKLSGF